MNCDFIKGKIYEWIYNDVHQLDDEQIQHIADCVDCKTYYQDCQKAKKITALLSQKEPILINPQKLTSNILDSLDESGPEKHSVRFRIFNTSKRILAAAAVFLIFVFAYEQYIIIDKMIKLEEQMSEVTATTVNSSQLKQILRYYPSHGIEAIKSKLAYRVNESQDRDLKSAFMLASLNALSNDEVKSLLQEYMVQVRFSNEDSGATNTFENESPTRNLKN